MKFGAKNELKRRGYDVFIDKNGTKEIDFVAVRKDEKIYIQVCVQIPVDSDREVGNLMAIKDHYPIMTGKGDKTDEGKDLYH